MTRVVGKMLWEVWRLSWQSLFLRVVIVSLIAVFLVDRSEQRRDVNARDMVLLGVCVLIFLQAVLSCLYAKFGEDKPGFPFYLGYSRPVPTWMLVLVPMGYFALSMAAMYFLPVLLLILIFDVRLPLLTGTSIISVTAVICAMCNWWSVNKLQRGAAWLVAYLAFDQVLFQKVVGLGERGAILNYLMTVTILDFPGLVVAALLAIGVAVFGVDKQRHGDVIDLSRFVVRSNLMALKSTLLKSEFLTSLEWLKGLYVRRCPSHSPVAAELWRELKTRGVPVFATGILVSIVVPVMWYSLNLTAVSGAVPKAPPGTPPAQLPLLITATVLPLSLPLVIATANLFGISKRRGRVDISTFDATLPITTLRQISLRLFVAVSSLIISLVIIGVTLWHSTPLITDIYDYSASKVALAAVLDTMSWLEIPRDSYVYLIQFITLVLSFGIMQLLWVLYSRRILYGVSFFLIYVVFLAAGSRNEWFTFPIIVVHLWLITGAVALSTGYLMFDVLRRSALSRVWAAGIFGIWLLYVPGYFWTLMDNGELTFTAPAFFIGWKFMISMLPLTGTVLSLWTVSKFRNR